ncbi:MAG: ribosome maturation factor RimM [Synergistaceae bacterium]|jgi:16S rRNA processing protein RimM|nr:ribosome maturation factor RimM [Synergistaceae bacterium]
MSTSRKDARKLAEGREGRILIGRIIGAHGVKGTFRVHPLTDYPERFLEMTTLSIEKPGKPPRVLEVESVTHHVGKGQFLMEAAGIDGRDEAESLFGYLVTVASDERVELPEGEYWIDSLIGLDVLDAESGDLLGVIEDVMPTGGNDVYQVRTTGGEAKMIPAISDVVREINVEGGAMRVTLLDGLWD